MAKLKKDFGLKIELKGQKVIIAIGISALAYATTHGEWFEHFDPDGEKMLKIEDEFEWARGIVWELLAEDEDGTTLVHQMFDKAAQNHYEGGGEGAAEDLVPIK